MKIVENTYSSSYEIKKSTFLAFLTPFSEFEALHERLKNEHPKAAHVVWAYRYLNEFSQIVENSSDDGEPKGTSGPPILNVMRGLNLVNAAIFVVRYFGGIKLGTGGLVRAYGTSAKMVLDSAQLKNHEIKSQFSFTCKYFLVRNLEHFLTKENILIHERVFDSEDILWKIDITKEQKEKLINFLDEFIKTQNAVIL